MQTRAQREWKERRDAERARNRSGAGFAGARGRADAQMGGTTRGPAPKSPADHNQAVRDLAMGEHCQVRYAPVCRHPATEYTVWAHTNTQAHQKGMGYKAHDSEGMFACDRCHDVIDRRMLPPIQVEELVRAAKQRTVIRLRFLARDPAERPWRRRAAQWVLDQLASRKGTE